jgi:hypoxanthine-DNA glycosylase
VRESSADSDILEEVPNDFHSFFKSHPHISRIYFNGNNAADFFLRFFPNISPPQDILPSTSPANTWKTFDEKVESWNKVIESLS